MAVVVETTVGDFTIDLYIKDRPRTCLNFLKLCKQHYYNFNLLFSIERNFVAQTGDPTGSGRGGDSIFKSMFGEQARLYEGEKLPVLRHTRFGTVSMATYGSHTYGSQFFITLGDDLESLDEEHLVFGHVSEGLDVVAKLNDVLTDEKNRPYQDIRICHTVVLDDPFPDPDNVMFPDESPRPTPEVLASDYIAVDESVEDTAGKDIGEIQEEIAAKEAEARATILEMVGDLPDADTAPPENVLFVCKLNPVTTSEDLEIIFSRFGKINCAEVIKDRITGNSLQYAFIEFNETKSCEDAYFKMDNVLIDDRRIHVDFSQSVSKIKWKGKGRGVELYDDKGKKLLDKKDNQFKSKERDSSIKNNDAPKSRFIDTEAYGKRYKERHEAENKKGASYRNEERRHDRGQNRDSGQETRKRGGYRDDLRARGYGDDRRYDEHRRTDRDHRDMRFQEHNIKDVHHDRDRREKRQDAFSHLDNDSKSNTREDYDNRRDWNKRDSPRTNYSQELRQRDHRRHHSPRDNTDHHRAGREETARNRVEGVEKGASGGENGTQEGHQRHKMMAMLRSELGGSKARKATGHDTSDSDSSSNSHREKSKKKKSKKKKRDTSESSDSSDSEKEKKKNKTKRRDSSSDSEDEREKRKIKKKRDDNSADDVHNRNKKKKKKNKKRADSSSDEPSKRKKSKKNKQ